MKTIEDGGPAFPTVELMSREVRKVPADWVHPKDEVTGRHQPMYDEDYLSACERWKKGYAAWYGGQDDSRKEYPLTEYWDWNGMPPDQHYYRPAWPEETRTHYQMYQTTSEGTPISPVMESPEKLARWLADNKASAFAGMTATYEEWLKMIGVGSVPSAVINTTTGTMKSGVVGL